MKTTIELPDDLAREAEARGSLAGKSLPDLVAEGLRLLLHATSAQTVTPDQPSQQEDPWDAMRRDFKSPFPGLSAMETLDEFRGRVELLQLLGQIRRRRPEQEGGQRAGEGH